MVSYPCYNVVLLGGISLENCLFLSIFAVFRCFRQTHHFSLTARNHACTYQKVKSSGSFEKKRSRAFHIWSHILANMLFSWVEFQLEISNCRCFFGGFCTACQYLSNIIPILDFVKNIKEMAVLETTSQDLSRYFPISLLSVHLTGWNFDQRWIFVHIWMARGQTVSFTLCWFIPISVFFQAHCKHTH